MASALLDAGQVLRDLDEIWRGIGKGEGAGVLRACAMTVIAVSPQDDDPQEAVEVLARLTKEHPSRVVLVRLREGLASPESRANVQCWMPFGRRQQICAEQIEIDAAVGRLNEVLPVVRGVLVPDLPVVLWARSLSVAQSAEFAALVPLAGKVILDTAGAKNAKDVLPLLESLRGSRAAVADLAWTRLTRWRETVFNLFRGRERGEQLQCLRRIGLKWAGEGIPTTVAYLGGWLKSVAPKAELELGCIDRKLPERGMGRIRELTFSCKSSTLRLYRPEGVGVAIEIDQLQQRALFPRLDTECLLREELSVLGRDTRFESAFENAAEVANAAVEMA